MLNREKNRLRNEKWGVCQNTTKFMVGVDGWKSSDIVVKCESCMATVNDCKLLQICYHSSTASEKSFVEKTIVQNPLEMTRWNIFREFKNDREKMLHE